MRNFSSKIDDRDKILNKYWIYLKILKNYSNTTVFKYHTDIDNFLYYLYKQKYTKLEQVNQSVLNDYLSYKFVNKNLSNNSKNVSTK